MTRAEQEANKAYPTDENSTVNYVLKLGFIDGYKQAEQDLALTWEDIRTINQMISAVVMEDPDDGSFELSEQQFYEEVLKRFNKTR